MDTYRITDLLSLRQHLAQSYKIFQLAEPSNQQPGSSHWQEASAIEQSSLVTSLPLTSPKSLFFAERENTFSFDGTQFRETLPEVQPFALFGVQSCDLTAIAYQDQFFAEDPYYQARRQKALLVGVDCTSPCDQGFCPAVDAGPGVKSSCADLILHPQQSGDWLLLVCNDKGKQAITGLALTLADEFAHVDREQQINQCSLQFGDLSHIHDGIEQLVNQTVPESFWSEVGIQCLSCSGCTSLCPTCSCYGTRELQDDVGNYSQQRFWDSCLYEGFQREASQHNPAQEAGSRLQRFWTHKFSVDTQSRFGRDGCVGCGRCEQTCPGVIGAHSIMKRILNNKDANSC